MLNTFPTRISFGFRFGAYNVSRFGAFLSVFRSLSNDIHPSISFSIGFPFSLFSRLLHLSHALIRSRNNQICMNEWSLCTMRPMCPHRWFKKVAFIMLLWKPKHSNYIHIWQACNTWNKNILKAYFNCKLTISISLIYINSYYSLLIGCSLRRFVADERTRWAKLRNYRNKEGKRATTKYRRKKLRKNLFIALLDTIHIWIMRSHTKVPRLSA